MIKYLGSKRRLVPVLSRIAAATGARSALDLFTGTTRVAQAFKAQGMEVTAVDTARYAETFARCYVATDARCVERRELAAALAYLDSLPGEPGYVTETFCVRSRFFQPFNGERIDAVRETIEREFSGSPLYPVLLTSLIEAADRVDSTTGVQMAYVKEWAPRSYRPLELRVPGLLEGTGTAVRGDAVELAGRLGEVDLAYLDPPYNQHRYFTNYHVWETLVAWDRPAHYGVACKRVDARDPATRSPFNSKRTIRDALAQVVGSLNCTVLVLSYNDESWITPEELTAMCDRFESVATLGFESARYVGARIGIFNPAGRKVGRVSHLTNRELVVVAGPAEAVERAAGSAAAGGPFVPRGQRTGRARRGSRPTPPGLRSPAPGPSRPSRPR
ncbi:MAG TPA: DNA adenine methylase [Acidimicrobiales bacterium]|nr:DNA adenine methylase [Acidimicrobiales bacterium]